MNYSTRIAFAEVDLILTLLEKKYSELIPKELRYTFYVQKDKNHKKKIDIRKPLTEQNLTEETISILALLNYEYWCKNEKEKNELIIRLCENDYKEEREIKEKYNPDNLFKTEKERLNRIVEETKKEMVLAEQNKKKNFITIIINKIKSFFEIK